MTELSANLEGSKTLYLSNTIKNTGTLLTKSFCVNYYIKNKKTSQSKCVGQYYYNGLSGGKVKKQNITFSLPTKIIANNYYVTASVDAHKTVKESNETNNCRTVIIKTV